MQNVQHIEQPTAERVLTKATLRAAKLLGVSQAELAQIIGLSEPMISKMSRRGALLPNDAKKRELAAFFVRIFRSLDAIVGGDHATAAAWLRNENTALGAVPIEEMKRVDGLVGVLAYLDQRRAAA